MPKVRIGICVVALMSTSLIAAVPARADSASDFLAMVSKTGLDVGSTSTDSQFALALGTELCELMNYGFTPEVASQQVKYEYPKATPEQSAAFTNAAQASKLCSTIFAPLNPGAY